MSEREIDVAVRREQARAIRAGLPRTLGGNAFAAAIAAAVLGQQLPPVTVGLWLTFALMVLGLRYACCCGRDVTTRLEADPDGFLRMTAIGGFAGGVVWSFVPFLAAGPQSATVGAFAIFVLNSVTAGAIVLSSAHAATGLSFATTVLGVLAGTLALRGDLNHVGFAVCVLIFLVILARAALAAEATFRDAMRLKHEKGRLADSLQTARDHARAAAAELEQRALLDDLTGLANRTAFNIELTRELHEGLASGDAVAVLLLDVDHFKTINDTLGHGAGDVLLVELGRRLRQTVRDRDVVARLGGDEFAIVVAGDDVGRLVPDIALRVLEAVMRPLELDGRRTQVGASIGIAMFPKDAIAPDELLACADMALYQSKDMGRRRWSAFDPALGLRARARRELELDLHEALIGDRLEFHFQPQVSIRDGSIVGFETLLRWYHPKRGWVPPPAVIAAAHAEHLAADLTRRALEAACDFLEWLAAHGHGSVRVAVNISPRDIASYAFSDLVADVIEGRAFAPGRLEIEITEDVMLDPTNAGRQLAHLEELGIALAVDDFGVGYSSLAYLRDLNIASIKIDRRFVTNIVGNEGDRVLVQAIRSVGDSLGIQLVAEGVETSEQLSVLRTLGCDVAQGFLFSPALTFGDATAWVEAHGRRSLLSE